MKMKFRVLSAEQFAKEAEEKKGGEMTINVPVEITVGGISVFSISVLIVLRLWKEDYRRFKN